MSVYTIFNKDDKNQFYIGSTNNFIKRKINHQGNGNNPNQKLYKLINECGGWDNFKIEVLEYCENYREREIELIKTLQPPMNTKYYKFSREQKKECDKDYRLNNQDKIKKYREETKEHNYAVNKEYRDKNRKKINKQVREASVYRKSWGGDCRYHNNLLKIDITLFD